MKYVKFVFVLCILINTLLCCQQGATVPKLYWSKKEGERVVDFDGVPFSVEKVGLSDCHYLEQYKKPKEYKARRLRLHSTHTSTL